MHLRFPAIVLVFLMVGSLEATLTCYSCESKSKPCQTGSCNGTYCMQSFNKKGNSTGRYSNGCSTWLGGVLGPRLKDGAACTASDDYYEQDGEHTHLRTCICQKGDHCNGVDLREPDFGRGVVSCNSVGKESTACSGDQCTLFEHLDGNPSALVYRGCRNYRGFTVGLSYPSPPQGFNGCFKTLVKSSGWVRQCLCSTHRCNSASLKVEYNRKNITCIRKDPDDPDDPVERTCSGNACFIDSGDLADHKACFMVSGTDPIPEYCDAYQMPENKSGTRCLCTTPYCNRHVSTALKATESRAGISSVSPPAFVLMLAVILFNSLHMAVVLFAAFYE